MRCVHLVDGKTVQLNYMWLPTWIGQNHQLKVELEKELRHLVVDQPATEETLDTLHDAVIDYLVKKYPIDGLFDYLDGLKYVEIDG